jgi:hypothetical protein
MAWSNHIEGACGELAVAKLLNIYWPASVDTFLEVPDVGCLEVRTRRQDTYDLLVRDQDSDDRIYVHVTGVIPVFTVWGWMWGGEAKHDRWKRSYAERPDAYFIPSKHLKPMRKLIDMIEQANPYTKLRPV